MFRKSLLIITCLALSLGARADFVTGEKEFDNRNYSVAFKEFLPEADAGDMRSQYYIGYLYLYGLGVGQNNEKALEYLKASSEQGYSSAQTLMGYLYEEGQIVPMDKKKAISLYQEAVAQNNASAMFNLGLAYYRGDAIVKNEDKAIELLEQVPMENQPLVGRYLGDIYINSRRSDKTQKATEAYSKSAKKGDIPSFYSLGLIYSAASNYKKAFPYYEYAASSGYAPAQYLLGTLYVNGDENVSKDLIKGHAWLEMASTQRYEPAISAVSELDRTMTLSESEAARKEFNRIQQEVMNKTESPFIVEQRAAEKALAEAQVKQENTTGRRRRRRR